MHINCPHCQNPIEVVEEMRPKEVVCPSCGSSIQVDPGRTATFFPTTGPRRVGKFEFLEELGVGAFGTVYKAHDTELDRLVAIKVPRAGNLATKDDIDRFLREARSAAQLKHPGIVSVHDAGQLDGSCYVVSELVHGTTLADRLATKRLTFRDSATLLAEIADALDYAHREGVIHRDLKPSNIMLDLDSKPHVMDFGLAKRDAGEITMTLDGQVLGTPAYMSPEQARGEGHDVDPRSDVYSLGVILYELITGELPFRGNKRMLIVQVLQDEPRPPCRINDSIPRDLETITLKCLAKEPSRRYGSAGELADDLRRYLNGEPVQARPVGSVERAWRWAKRNPRVAMLSGAVALLLVAVAVSSLIMAVMAERHRRFADARAQRDLSVSYNRLGDLSLEAGQVTESLGYFQKFLEISRRLAAADPTDAQAQRYLSISYEKLGDVSFRAGQLTESLGYFQKLLEISRKLAAADPMDAQAQRDLSISYEKLGDVSFRAGQVTEAVGYFQKCLEISQKLAAVNPSNARAQRGLLVSFQRIGEVHETQKQYEKALVSYFRGLVVLGSLPDQKRNPPTEDWIVDADHVFQVGLHSLPALCDLQTLLEQPADVLPFLLVCRGSNLAKAGRRSDAVQSVAKLRELGTANANQLYDAACVYSLCAAGIKPEKEELTSEQAAERKKHIDHALETLREAIKAGWNDFALMQRHTDLTVLRDLPEFKALIPQEQ